MLIYYITLVIMFQGRCLIHKFTLTLQFGQHLSILRHGTLWHQHPRELFKFLSCTSFHTCSKCIP